MRLVFQDMKIILKEQMTSSSTEIDGNIVTGKGAGVAIEFALKIVEELKNKKTAEELAEKMVVNN